jgi:hypothetical protein
MLQTRAVITANPKAHRNQESRRVPGDGACSQRLMGAGGGQAGRRRMEQRRMKHSGQAVRGREGAVHPKIQGQCTAGRASSTRPRGVIAPPRRSFAAAASHGLFWGDMRAKDVAAAGELSRLSLLPVPTLVPAGRQAEAGSQGSRQAGRQARGRVGREGQPGSRCLRAGQGKPRAGHIMQPRHSTVRKATPSPRSHTQHSAELT